MPYFQNYSMLWDLLPFPAFIINKLNLILSVNHAAELYFLSSSKSLLNKNITEIFPGSDLSQELFTIVREKKETRVYYDLNFNYPTIEQKGKNVHFIPFGKEDLDILILIESNKNIEHLKNSLTYRSAAKSVTKMSSMLAHEIRNPLAGIYGAAELLEKSVKNDDQELTELIKVESKRISKLVDTFEKFGDIKRLNLCHFNVHDILDRAIRSMVPIFNDNITTTKDYDPSLPDVFGDPDQMLQVFQNLIKNSFEAIGSSPGNINIQTKFKIGFKNLPLVVIISDSGSGIPKNLQGQIFQPFISSKDSGSGLGLSLVSKIVSDHNGIIDFVSGEYGTKFRLLMPIKKIIKDFDSDLDYFQLDSGDKF